MSRLVIKAVARKKCLGEGGGGGGTCVLVMAMHAKN